MLFYGWDYYLDFKYYIDTEQGAVKRSKVHLEFSVRHNR